MSNEEGAFPVITPDLQISFYFRLQEVRNRYLQEALAHAVSSVPLQQINSELTAMVDDAVLKKVATFGLRGEIFFAVPVLMAAAPHLLGYYRLLLGFSQKEMYNKGPFCRFKILEDRGIITPQALGQLPAFCSSLIRSAEFLVNSLDDLSLNTVHEMQLLTLGPQLRGSQNTRIGGVATRIVYTLIHDFIAPYIVEKSERLIEIENSSGRKVLIEFFSDPDISIREVLPTGVRPLVSVEIKGGTDASNIHNRLGEAEKSHQKARQRGFAEFWTLIRVNIDYLEAKRETPTTHRFFHLDRIANSETQEYREFRDLLCSLLGIRNTEQ